MTAFILLLITATALALLSFGVAGGWPESIYTSPWMLALWSATAFSAIFVAIRRKIWRLPATTLLHIALLLILAGGAVTLADCHEGEIHLRKGAQPVATFNDNGNDSKLPFRLLFHDFTTETYPNTSTPLDFHATLKVSTENGDNPELLQLSLNNVARYNGYKMTLLTADSDSEGFSLKLRHDTAGTIISFTAYILLGISMILYFLEPRSLFRDALRKITDHTPGKRILPILMALLLPFAANAMKIPDATVKRFGALQTLHNGRIAPVATVASDFTASVTGGSTSWKGHDAEEILTGFIFDLSAWKKAPLIKVKDKNLQKILGISGNRACYQDYMRAVTSGHLDITDKATAKRYREDISRFESVTLLLSGHLLKIFPVNEKGSTSWYSPADRLPSGMDSGLWLFVKKSIGLINGQIMRHDFAGADSTIDALARYQRKTAGENIGGMKLHEERFYNRFGRGGLTAAACATLGLLCFILGAALPRQEHRIFIMAWTLCLLAFAWVSILIGIRWHIGGHVPLSNGFETMQFMGWCLLLCGGMAGRGIRIAAPICLLGAGLSLAVAAMSGNATAVTPLMPVLASPLLSVHVVCVMMSYALLLMAMLIGVIGLCRKSESAYLAAVARVLTIPAVFLLGAGIFIGAVWADVSWGRYWSWDPKETWALITFIIYSLPLHPAILKRLSRSIAIHIFNIAAFASVLITYFGVNFFLGGLHSYA